MLKTAHLLAALLLLCSVAITNTASAESLRQIMEGVVPGKIFTAAAVTSTRPRNPGGTNAKVTDVTIFGQGDSDFDERLLTGGLSGIIVEPARTRLFDTE